MLLERGRPDLEATSSGGETALYCAVSKGDEQMVRRLLRQGAKASTTPSGGQPVLYRAISKGHKEIVHMLLESNDVEVDTTPSGGSTPMYKAAKVSKMSILFLFRDLQML